MYSKIVKCVLPAYTKSWLDRTNERSFTIAGFSSERFLVSVFLASEKFDSVLELDARMHKIEPVTHDMMRNERAPFTFHHKRILNLAMVSRFIVNPKLTLAMIPFFFRASTTLDIEFWNPLGRIGFNVGWEM